MKKLISLVMVLTLLLGMVPSFADYNAEGVYELSNHLGDSPSEFILKLPNSAIGGTLYLVTSDKYQNTEFANVPNGYVGNKKILDWHRDNSDYAIPINSSELKLKGQKGIQTHLVIFKKGHLFSSLSTSIIHPYTTGGLGKFDGMDRNITDLDVNWIDRFDKLTFFFGDGFTISKTDPQTDELIAYYKTKDGWKKINHKSIHYVAPGRDFTAIQFTDFVNEENSIKGTKTKATIDISDRAEQKYLEFRVDNLTYGFSQYSKFETSLIQETVLPKPIETQPVTTEPVQKPTPSTTEPAKPGETTENTEVVTETTETTTPVETTETTTEGEYKGSIEIINNIDGVVKSEVYYSPVDEVYVVEEKPGYIIKSITVEKGKAEISEDGLTASLKLDEKITEIVLDIVYEPIAEGSVVPNDKDSPNNFYLLGLLILLLPLLLVNRVKIYEKEGIVYVKRNFSYRDEVRVRVGHTEGDLTISLTNKEKIKAVDVVSDYYYIETYDCRYNKIVNFASEKHKSLKRIKKVQYVQETEEKQG